MPERSNRQSKAAILIAALIALLSLLPALYAWAVRFTLRRTLRFLREGDFWGWQALKQAADCPTVLPTMSGSDHLLLTRFSPTP